MRPLLGFEAGFPGPPCTISVPNLMTDRPFLVLGGKRGGNVRRLMYQSLIWTSLTGDETRGLAAALDAEDLERAPDALIDRMRRNSELGGDFFGREMVVD